MIKVIRNDNLKRFFLSLKVYKPLFISITEVVVMGRGGSVR